MTQLQLKDVLHLYLGCECLLGDPKWKRSDISASDRAPFTDPDYGKPVRTKLSFHLMQHFGDMHVNLILRHLSDMTEEEKAEFQEIYFNDNFKLMPWFTDTKHISMVWMLKKGFDIFGLIESNQAINKTTI